MNNTQQIKALIIANQSHHQEVRNISHVPRVGDNVDMFYKPAPEVVKVLWWPNEEDLKMKVDVLIVVR